MKLLIFVVALITGATVTSRAVADSDGPRYWMRAKASERDTRTKIVETGASLEVTRDDYVIVIGGEKQRAALHAMGILEATFPLGTSVFDFPAKDSKFHSYAEMKQKLEELHARFPSLTELGSIGKSVEGRDILKLRISGDLANADSLPGTVFMGGHHAREHVSVEVPILLAQYLVEKYQAGDARIVKLLDHRDVEIIPMVNPDGAEFDVASGSYQYWRKNRGKNRDGTTGTDLNRNYDHLWGISGSSRDPDSEIYMGSTPFSEPETQAIRDFFSKQTNTTMLLSFHTFSELILYPWGGTDEPVSDLRDRTVFETMAKRMSKWNGYQAMQSSDLYVASGDTVDWAYATHKIFGFTFELDPTDTWNGGFYPGQRIVPGVFKKNLEACLYMIDLADNPYRSTEATSIGYGLRSPLVN